MLGKQGWRLLAKPDAIISRIFKAKYYPTGNFLNASLGHNPSYSWRSIWASRVVINKGYRWRIGNGSNINIWTEPWLRDSLNFHVETTMTPELPDWTVNDLMIPGLQEWDHELIENIFCERDIKAISEIPLVSIQTTDQRIWHYSKDGNYSVKSGYHLVMNLAEEEDRRAIFGDWKALWRLKIPPKVKFFLWRSCRECLPTRANLQSRGIVVPLVCVLCEKDIENAWHMFIMCPYARECWNHAKLLQIVDANSLNSEGFSEWFFKVVHALSGLELSKFAVILWAIWKQRNSKLWNNQFQPPSRMVRAALEFLYEWLVAAHENNEEAYTLRNQQHVSVWKPPPPGSFKCNIDAAFFGDIRSAGLGMIVRDDNGFFVVARTRILPGLCCVKEGEAIGAYEALLWVNALGLNNVIFEIDALMVYQAMKTSITDLSEFGRIISACQSLLNQNPCFSFNLVRRQANEIAHVLARQSRFHASPYVWLESPSCIGDLLSASVPDSNVE